MLKKMTKTFGAVVFYAIGLGCIPYQIVSTFIDSKHTFFSNTVTVTLGTVWTAFAYKCIKNIWHDSEDATKLLGAANTDATTSKETPDEI